MKTRYSLCLSAAAMAAFAVTAGAAPVVTRLTPPSALFSYNDATPPYVSRFMQDQRFDLQATIQADAGKTITGVVFKVDGKPVASPAGAIGTSLTAIGGDKFNATLRAYSNAKDGVRSLTVEVTQSDSVKATATGNFEIVGVKRHGGHKAKNVIWLIGDGMGIAHRTAARIVSKGVAMGKSIEPLAMDKLPVTGIVTTHSLNSIVTDSAPGAHCYSTGNKANNGQEGVFPDDTPDKWDNPRIEHMGSYLARTEGKWLGIVTTADVEDATPAAFAVSTQDRGAGTGIGDMYLDECANISASSSGHNFLHVLMGGGRKWFIPTGSPGSGRVNNTTASGADYTVPAAVQAGWNVPAGTADSARNLIGDFQSAGFYYAPDNSGLGSMPANTTRLLGLFNSGHMDVSLDKIANRRAPGTIAPGSLVASYPDQPMLDEMTDKALTVLNKNPDGFVMMIEGASIDKQAHNMDSERWIVETIEFDRTIQKCLDFQAANPDTLIIVTADHECAGINIIGSSLLTNTALHNAADTHAGTPAAMRTPVVGTYDNAKFPVYTMEEDGYPQTMDVDYKMLIGYAASADRYEDWLTNATYNESTATRDSTTGFFIAGQATAAGSGAAVHTASDIPISAGGAGSSAFTGVFDNTEPFFKVMQTVIGGAK